MNTRPPVCLNGHRHRTWRTYRLCLTRTAAWVRGEGRWALIAYCDVPTVSLHPSRLGAYGARRWLNLHGCGHGCFGAHHILQLREDQEGQA